MDDKSKPEKYRKLSIAALVCGILVFTPFILQLGPIQPPVMGTTNFCSGMWKH